VAKESALDNACVALASWLAANGAPEWIPSARYLQENNLVRFAEPKLLDVPNSEAAKVEVQVDLQVTAVQAGAMQQKARLERMNQRQMLWARVLAAVVALVVVFGGYLRLEEATRGYYTLLLRAVAFIVLVCVGAGLWLWT
jgi:hypothetical protein